MEASWRSRGLVETGISQRSTRVCFGSYSIRPRPHSYRPTSETRIPTQSSIRIRHPPRTQEMQGSNPPPTPCGRHACGVARATRRLGSGIGGGDEYIVYTNQVGWSVTALRMVKRTKRQLVNQAPIAGAQTDGKQRKHNTHVHGSASPSPSSPGACSWREHAILRCRQKKHDRRCFFCGSPPSANFVRANL
jgi:hypothetical protein